MNKYQRIILITAAIVLIVALWTTPKYVILFGRPVKWRPTEKSAVADVVLQRRDPNTAAIRSIGVIGASLFLYFAAGNGLRRKKGGKSNGLETSSEVA